MKNGCHAVKTQKKAFEHKWLGPIIYFKSKKSEIIFLQTKLGVDNLLEP